MKFIDYAAHGVREYWLVDPETRSIEQYELDPDGRYRLLRKLDAGSLTSIVLSDFPIDVAAVFNT